MLYKFLDASDAYRPFIAPERHRSQTVIVANTERPSAQVIAQAKQAGMVVGSGYGTFKESQIRIANFPAVSAEQVTALIAQLQQ